MATSPPPDSRAPQQQHQQHQQHSVDPTAAAAASPPSEQLLDVFKAAALSVTKLFRTAAAAEARARSDGYQDCLDDLLALLDRENLGLDDGEGWRIRQWATEKLGGRETSPQVGESEDESETANNVSSGSGSGSGSGGSSGGAIKTEPMSSPTLPTRVGSTGCQPTSMRPDVPMRTESAPPVPVRNIMEQQEEHEQQEQAPPQQQTPPQQQATPQQQQTQTQQMQQQQQQQQQHHHHHHHQPPAPQFIMPSQDTFMFQSQHPYPNIATLDLSDTRSHEAVATATATSPSTRFSRRVNTARAGSGGGRSARSLGKGAGSKRKLNFDEIFGLAGTDVFGGNVSKRSKHT